MSDTVKIERPLFSRRQSDIGGRVKLDSKGNVLVVKTRVSDMQTLPTLDPSGEPAKLQLRETRRELEQGWLAASEVLRSQGQTALAEQTRHFVCSLRPARTEREWLMAGLLEQTGRQRAPREVERTR